MANDQNLDEQMETAADTIRAVVLRLLRDDVYPQLVLLAVARVTGELGASAALASGTGVEAMLEDLAEVVRQAGREQAEVIEAARMPPAGSA